MTDAGTHAGAPPGRRADHADAHADAEGASARLCRHQRALRQSIARAEAHQTRHRRSAAPCADGAEPPALAILRGELAETERALRRLADGAYGRCVWCAQPIAPARLRVVPSAQRCDACAQRSGSAAAPRHMPTIYGEGHPGDECRLV